MLSEQAKERLNVIGELALLAGVGIALYFILSDMCRFISNGVLSTLKG